MAVIKNIIFDLGGVLLDINYHNTSASFKKLGVKNFEDLYSQAGANDLFEALETGDISEEKFYATMQQYCMPGTIDSQVQTAWSAMLLNFRKDSLLFLSSLKDRYQLFLLSNTNSIHLADFNKIFSREIPGPSLDSYFKKTYYSHLMHRRKPYPATYQFVLDDAGIKAHETLFIDDSWQNIEGSKESGLHTHLLLSSEKIENIGL